MSVDEKLRLEIREWAMKKAMQDAIDNGRASTKLDEYEPQPIGNANWIQERFWHYEKMAYLKIHNREKGITK